MAASRPSQLVTICSNSEMERAPLLVQDDLTTVNGAIDCNGQPALRSKTGVWKSAAFIIGVEVAERCAFYGILSNLVNYLTGPLGQSTATAAQNVNTWDGTALVLPLLGAFLADSYFGRYRTIILASMIYVLGLALLTLSAQLSSFSSNSQLQVVVFFSGLYLVALGQGGHKPCVQAFGADQFDEQHAEEFKARSSFFNWWYFMMCAGILFSLLILNYIQDNLSWSFGFGIPCLAMVIALVVFLLGTTTYRFDVEGDGKKNPFARIIRVFLTAIKNWRAEEAQQTTRHLRCGQFKFLDKALNLSNVSTDEDICSTGDVEEAKGMVRIFPIWATMLIYGIVAAQVSTFFTKQGATMERTILKVFKIPSASLQSLTTLAIVVFTPIYDQVFVPIARSFSGKSSGITMLQRIGTGMFLSFVTMVIAAVIEAKRLKIAKEYGLLDMPNATIPLSVWWLIPQYCLLGVSQVFTMVGLQEFFYGQVPNELRSMGLALYLSIFGAGSFLSSMLISMIEKATKTDTGDSWFANNLNHAHLDYFYWLLAGLSVVGWLVYLYIAKSYVYKAKTTI